MNRMPTKTGLAIVLAAVLTTPACAPLLIGGAAVGATAVAQERRVGDALDDATIQTDLEGRLLQEDEDLFRRVNVEVVESRVLLLGVVNTEDARASASRLAWSVPYVKEVVNEIQVGEGDRWGAYPSDFRISSQLRIKLIRDAEVHQINYNIETVRGVVYLMGIAESQGELDRVVDHARTIGGVERVASYVRIK